MPAAMQLKKMNTYFRHLLELTRIPQAARGCALLLLAACTFAIAGCGSGGYPGGGIVSLSSSSVTIDAGQSFQVNSTVDSNPLVSWTLGGSCNGNCGTVSSATGTSTIYTAPASVASQVKLTLTAAVPGTRSSSVVNITVNPAPTIAGTTPTGTVGVPYTATLTASGGTGALRLSIAGGTLPEGLTFNSSTGVIQGTPTTEGSSTITVQVTDASDVPMTVTSQQTIRIHAAGAVSLSIAGNPPAGVVGVAYSTTLQATGGTSPYSWSVISGSLPAGLSLSSDGVISGTPTTLGSAMFTVQVQDASGDQASTGFSIAINAGSPTLSIGNPTLPGGTVNVLYSGTIPVTGGTGPYTCVVSVGSLPAGLTLNSNCIVSGTPTTPGTFTVTVTVTDSSNPAQTTTGTVTITIAPASLALTLSNLPNATVGTPYNATIGATGGTSPYSCTITAGALPAGLTLTGCTVSGTPTISGTANLTVKVTDAGSPAQTTSGPVTLTVQPAPLSLTTTSLPDGTVGVVYSGTIAAIGGTSPYTCAVTGGSMPAGLALNSNCTVTGTPTTYGTSSITVTVTDSATPAQTTSGPVTLLINPAPLVLTLTSLPNATVGTLYSAPLGVSGGRAPYDCTITAGALPAGLTLTGCTVTGTPTTAGTANLTVKVTDASSPVATISGPVSLTVQPAPLSLTTSSLPFGTVGVPYSETIGVTGGTSPYTCAVAGGSMPGGLTLNSNCTVTGTPTTPGTTSVTVSVIDSATPAQTTSGPISITINSGTLTLAGTLPNAVLNQSYSQSLSTTGGVGPYTYQLINGTTLPAGLSLALDGTISGTPTAVGAVGFTVQVTDSSAPQQLATHDFVLLVVYPSGPNNGELNGPYAFLFQGYDDVVSGVLAYQTATVGSFTADGNGLISTGELDTNHQGSGASSSQFYGSYQVNADNRGMMALTTLNTDGSIGGTKIYAISLKAPAVPTDPATQAQMIEYDGDILIGSRGSGSILRQDSTAFAPGLIGNYAFGVSGDTPCLISCTVGISGPVAAVGQFSASSNNLTGMTDVQIASAKSASNTLLGSYLVADNNGRLTVAANLGVSNTNPLVDIASLMPSNYVAYIVDASHVFLMSNDTHTNFALLAGTAQKQTQPTFDNTSLNGALIGYENAQADPGLLGSTLQDVLNLSTATVFRTTAAANGSCNTTNVDIGGLNSLVTGVLGSVGQVLGLGQVQAILGRNASTGTADCTVGLNGRGVLAYPAPGGLLTPVLALLGLNNPPDPRIFYLVSPNQGYFLESSYAGIGYFEGQVNKPTFTLADLKGTYVYASQPSATLVGVNNSGYLNADGAGNITGTIDQSALNLSLGNLNILSLGSFPGTYSISSTPYAFLSPYSDATNGRFTAGNYVLYEIIPGRFVMVDTDILATSPTVTLLY